MCWCSKSFDRGREGKDGGKDGGKDDVSGGKGVKVPKVCLRSLLVNVCTFVLGALGGLFILLGLGIARKPNVM